MSSESCAEKAYCHFMGKANTFIKINGKHYMKTKTFGFHVVTIDHYTGKVLVYRTFDTKNREKDSASMANFLRSVPDGIIVAAVSYGDSSKKFTTALNNEIVRFLYCLILTIVVVTILFQFNIYVANDTYSLYKVS